MKLVTIILLTSFLCLSSTSYSGLVIQKYKWVCWAEPTEEVKEECKKSRKCDGTGMYALHMTKKEAEELVMRQCIKEFGECELDYCEKL